MTGFNEFDPENRVAEYLDIDWDDEDMKGWPGGAFAFQTVILNLLLEMRE